MFDYSHFSRAAAQDKDIVAIVDDLFQLAREHYPILSRLSVVLCSENKASNYFVSDSLCQNAKHHYIEQEIKPNSALSRLAESLETRIVDDLSLMNPTKQISHLLELGHQSSYTTPIHYQESNLGFVFINASCTDFFATEAISGDGFGLGSPVTGPSCKVASSRSRRVPRPEVHGSVRKSIEDGGQSVVLNAILTLVHVNEQGYFGIGIGRRWKNVRLLRNCGGLQANCSQQGEEKLLHQFKRLNSNV